MRVIVTGGGTGGHLYPGIQIARELCEAGHEVVFVASKNGIDQDIFAKETDLPFEVKYWDLRGFSRSAKDVFKNFATLGKVAKVMNKTKKLIKEFKPDFVIGMGGYISGPVVQKAQMMGIRTAIHEQNSYPGMTNRQLAKKVDYIFYTYEKALDYFVPGNNTQVIYSSNPRIDEARKYANMEFENVFENDFAQNILFLGGSLGAEAINNAAIEYAKANPSTGVNLVCGERYVEELASLDLANLNVYAYLQDQLKYIKAADLVVTRGGATTLLEVVALEKLTICIPSPNVVADHQMANARQFADQGMMKAIKETDLSLDLLSTEIQEMFANADEYIKQLNTVGNIESVKTIMDVIEEKNGNNN